MTITSLRDKPTHLPTATVQGGPLKTLTQVLLERRATTHFKPDPIPPEYLEAILALGGQAPSGYNLQPWRFIVVRNAENRKRLQQAAFDQAKVGEAPVMLITFAIRDEWRDYIKGIFDEGVRRSIETPEAAAERMKKAVAFMDKMPPPVWLSRHTMVALTTLMLVAESYGLDTAPMEGFDPDAVKREFGLPEKSEVIALLALGFAKEPDKAYGGRFAVEDIVFQERYGRRWSGEIL